MQEDKKLFEAAVETNSKTTIYEDGKFVTQCTTEAPQFAEAITSANRQGRTHYEEGGRLVFSPYRHSDVPQYDTLSEGAHSVLKEFPQTHTLTLKLPKKPMNDQSRELLEREYANVLKMFLALKNLNITL